MDGARDPGTAATRVERPIADPTVRDVPQASERVDLSTITPEQALHADEVRRLRLFAGAVAGICAAGAATIVTLGGDPFARHVHVAAIAICGAVAALYFVVVRDVARYRAGYFTVLVAIASVTNATGFYYWGIFSGYIAVVTVSAYVIAVAGDRRTIVAGGAISLGSHLALGAATIGGVLDDRGLVAMTSMSRFDQIATLTLLELVVAGTMMLGFQTRKATRTSLAEHLTAIRDLARREAQLAEVRAEMRDALALAGRFTNQVIGGYKVGELLGRGAMGEVYAAEGSADRARCAIKLLAPHLAANAEARQRFQRELRAVEALTSPHIVRIVEVSPPDATLPYLVMERLDGIDLAAAIKDEPIRPLPEVVELVRQIAAGLDAAHAAGVVHRDLKPQNVFGIGPAGARTWKVLDFGIAKLVDSGGTLTHNQVVGTPGYMSPEQARGEHVDARTDVYALGVLAYRLLTGLPAVMPGEVHAMLYEVVHRMPPRPTSLAELPASVEIVLAVALAKRPDDRFGSAGALAQALAEAAADRLDPELATRAGEILTRTPWGHWARRGGERRRTTIAP